MTSPSKAVGIRELKNHLSAYLKEVKLGTTILVLDRETVIGELRPPGADAQSRRGHSVLETWQATGVISVPSLKKTACPAPVLRAPDGTAARILAELRGE